MVGSGGGVEDDEVCSARLPLNVRYPGQFSLRLIFMLRFIEGMPRKVLGAARPSLRSEFGCVSPKGSSGIKGDDGVGKRVDISRGRDVG